MCYLSAVADTERSGLTTDFGWQCWGLSSSGLTVRPRWNICSAAVLFCILYNFLYSTHFSHAQEHWEVTEGYASFSGHARIVYLFPNLATPLPKSWLSVQPGCLINCLFSGFQLMCLLWVSAADAGQSSSHCVCQCSKGEFKINVLHLTESNFWIFCSVEVNWCSSYFW